MAVYCIQRSSCMSRRAVLCCAQVLVFCEICHNVRKSFTLDQLAQVVSFMACTIADRAQMYNNQSTCVRLSLNLVECLYQVRSCGRLCLFCNLNGVGQGSWTASMWTCLP
jgi:hypothetical protein